MDDDGKPSQPESPFSDARTIWRGAFYLEEMMKYHEQIKHPLWQKKRLEVLDHKGFQCECCLTVEKELHVHHPFYKKGALIWDYEDEELQVLCIECHAEAHAIDEKIKKAMSLLAPEQKIRLLGFIDSMNGPFLNDNSISYLEGYADGIRGGV
jgi:hypothetical protein